MSKNTPPTKFVGPKVKPTITKTDMGPYYESPEGEGGVNRAPHRFGTGSAAGGHGFGHSVVKRSGHHRLSGNAGAHRIGKK